MCEDIKAANDDTEGNILMPNILYQNFLKYFFRLKYFEYLINYKELNFKK